MKTFDLLKNFCETPGPVGREDLVQDTFEMHLQASGLKSKRDKIGNLLATMEGERKHFAVVAHADEVGFLVSNIDENGFIRTKWNTRGHLPDLRLLPGQKVKVMTESELISGCFCVKTAHIAGPEGKKILPTYEDIFLDIGATSAEDVAEMGINVGDPVVYDSPVERVGRNIMGKSMDDRVGLTVMVKLLEHLVQSNQKDRPKVTFVSTVMEELGAKGAAAVARQLDVDAVLVLEIGLADDYPGTAGEAGVSLGMGPVVVIKDTEVHYSHKLNQRLLDTAEAANIPVQRAVYHNYATDGFQIAAQGEVVSAIGVPCRYSHSSFETVSPEDIENTISLILRFFGVSNS